MAKSYNAIDVEILLRELGEFYKKQSRMSFRERQRMAQQLLTIALRYKILLRPKYCSKCDKKARILGHHPDYRYPLKIQWLCNKCHGQARREINKLAK